MCAARRVALAVLDGGDVRVGPCAPRSSERCVGMDVAGRRTRAAAVLGRPRSLRSRAAPRHRHRCRARTRRACAGERHRLVRRLRSGQRPLGHDHNRRWVCGDVAPAWGDDRRSRQHRRGGSGGRRRRRERGRRHVAAPRPPRHSCGFRPGRVRRPARAAAGAAADGATAAGGRSTGTGGDASGRGASGRGSSDRRPAGGGRRARARGRRRACIPARATAGVLVARHRRCSRREPVRPAGRSRAAGDAAELAACRHVRCRAPDEGVRFSRGQDAAAGHYEARSCCN
jgi:hypothetical protein